MNINLITVGYFFLFTTAATVEKFGFAGLILSGTLVAIRSHSLVQVAV